MMNHSDIQNVWTFIPQLKSFQGNKLIDSLEDDLLQTILAIIQDGICILDNKLSIIYSNPAMNCWYSDVIDIKGRKCFEVYHKKTTPCKVCPVRKAFESKNPETEIVPYHSKDNSNSGWQRLYCAPVFDDKGEVVLVIEYIRNITNERRVALSSELIERQNKVLMNFLEQKEKERVVVEQNIVNNVEQSMKPILSYLKNILGDNSVEMVRRQLDFTIQSLTQKKSYMIERLSTRELQVAKMIRDKYLSKEIADQLMISKKSVDYHRTNIRKKLDLKPNDNLQRFLEANL